LYTKDTKAFTRNRKLSFKKVVLFLINLPKRSLSVELAKFFSITEEIDSVQTASKSAFSQARKNLDHKFFIDWNQVLLNEFYTDNEDGIKRWNGFRLMGTDGSTVCVPNKPDVVEHFGVNKNQNKSVPMARLNIHYDLLNHLSCRSVMSPFLESESFHAIQALDSMGDDMLTIYDRGYSGFAFVYLNIFKKKQFLIRYSLDFSDEIKEFVNSGKESSILTFKANRRAVERLKNFGCEIAIGATIQARAVKVKLDTGETEILVTSLTDTNKYPNEVFKELYFLRWGIETHYSVLKNLMQIEIFSGQSKESLLQDFHATIFTANLQSLLMRESEPELEKINEQRDLNYNFNRSVSLGLLKDEVIKIFMTNKPELVMKKLNELFLSHLEPVRPNRQYVRIIKGGKPRGKHRNFLNYKDVL
jgi:hypothetical protein